MGAVDLVIQVESPGAVSRGLQRIGRAGHPVGEPSRGTIFPKHRGDLLEAAIVDAPHGRRARSSTPATCATRSTCSPSRSSPTSRPPASVTVADLAALVRRCANFAELSDDLLGNVLDLLAGRYPSEEFSELRPRLVWDRINDTRAGPRRLQAAGGHERRHHPRPRAVRRVPARRHAGRRARRGDGLREPAGRDVRARRLHVAHRGHHVRAGHRHPGAGRAGQDAVLARRPPRPPARARPGARRVRPRDPRRCPASAAARAAARPLRPRRVRGRRTSCSTSTSRARPRASCPTTARSSSSASATRSATGGCASSARSARRCTRRGRWRSSAG